MTPKQKEQRRLFHILGMLCMIRGSLKYMAKYLDYHLDIDPYFAAQEGNIRKAMKHL